MSLTLSTDTPSRRISINASSTGLSRRPQRSMIAVSKALLSAGPGPQFGAGSGRHCHAALVALG